MYGVLSKGSAANVLGVLAIAVAAAGCDGGATSAGIREQKIDTSGSEREDLVESLPPDQGERPILRYQVDAARSRLWALTSDGVDLYEARTHEKLAHIALPDWLWVGEPYSCQPDLALGRQGEALISSNVVPTLWRVDPVTLAASRHELVLDEDTGKDIGFTGLVYSAKQDAFFAVSSSRGSLWRIDSQLRRAQNISLSAPLPKACGLLMQPRANDERASRFVSFCVRTQQGDSVVSLAPDQRSGYVRAGQCNN